jgi:hypothetical protein
MFISSFFEFIKVRHGLRDVVFDWVDVTQNASILFGIIPGLILYKFKPRRSIGLGVALITIALLLTSALVESESSKVAQNSKLLLFVVCLLSGQGACLVLLSSLQALMNQQTVLASAVISGIIISYFLGGDSFIQTMMFGYADETYFATFLTYLAVSGIVISIATCFVISDEEDAEGLFGKGEALTKGVLYKRFGYFYYAVLFIYLVTLLCALHGTNLETTTGASILVLLLIFNLCVPFLIFYCYDAARLKEMIGEADETEKFIGGKGKDQQFSEVVSGLEFWYTCVISMIVIGSAKMVVENTGPFSLGNQEEAIYCERAF